jgi:hypothetical protein
MSMLGALRTVLWHGRTEIVTHSFLTAGTALLSLGMAERSQAQKTARAGDSNEETIEFELPGEQLVALSEAGREAQTATIPVKLIADPAIAASLVRKLRRLWPAALVAIVVLLTSIAWWTAATRPTTERDASVATLPSLTAPAPQSEPALDPDAPVKIRNPFDANEVFEFPAGTDPTAARQSVAQLLLQRARERQSTDHNHAPRVAKSQGK